MQFGDETKQFIKCRISKDMEAFVSSQALAPALDFDSENIKKPKRTLTTGNACSSVQITKAALLRNQTMSSTQLMSLQEKKITKKQLGIQFQLQVNCGITVIHHSHLTVNQYLLNLLQKPQVLMSIELFFSGTEGYCASSFLLHHRLSFGKKQNYEQ